MKLCLNSLRANTFIALALAVSMFVAGSAAAAPPSVDESELLASGFKVLVATTSVQKEWVQNLPRGQIRPMQPTGKKFFIYPDSAGNQIYIGGRRNMRRIASSTRTASWLRGKQRNREVRTVRNRMT